MLSIELHGVRFEPVAVRLQDGTHYTALSNAHVFKHFQRRPTPAAMNDNMESAA